MQKVLITGANGFLGFYLIQHLQNRNYIIIATGKGQNRWPGATPIFSYETLDFSDRSMVNRVFRKHRPDIVIHCGAVSKPDDCEQNREWAFRTNVSGTIYLLESASLYKCFFIFLSTDFVFDGRKGMYEEGDKTNPVNYYGETKVLAEEEVKKYLYPWSIVRTVLVYGKTLSTRQNIVTNTAMALKRGETLRIFHDQVRTPTYVEDLALGIIKILEIRATGIYHLSGADILSPYDMAIAVARFLGLKEDLIKPVSHTEFHQPAKRPLRTGFNISKAKNILHYNCISFSEGLAKSLKE